MARKQKAKTKSEEDKPTAGHKSVKNVTFDAPDSGFQNQFNPGDLDARIEEVMDGPPTSPRSTAWGENLQGAGWDNASHGWEQPTEDWNNPSLGHLQRPPSISRSPHPSSPPPRPPSFVPDSSIYPKDSNLRVASPMSDRTHDGDDKALGGNHNVAGRHQWGTANDNTLMHTADVSMPPQITYQSPAEAAEALRMAKRHSASEAAKKLQHHQPVTHPTTHPASHPATHHAHHPAAHPAPVPPTPHPTAHLPVNNGQSQAKRSSFASQQTNPQPPSNWIPSINARPLPHFGNRNDYAVVAAAIEKELKNKAAAQGLMPATDKHGHNPNAQAAHGTWGPRNEAGPSNWHQAGGDAGWRRSHNGETSRKQKADPTWAAWGRGSEAGFSQSNQPARHRQQHDGHASKQHQATKNWENWGKEFRVQDQSETSEDEDYDYDEEEDDMYDDGGGWGDQGWGQEQTGTSRKNTAGGWGQDNDNQWGASGQGWGQDDSDQWGASGQGWGEQHGERKTHSGEAKGHGHQSQSGGQRRHRFSGVQLIDPPMRRSEGKKDLKSESLTAWPPNNGWEDSGWGPIQEEDEDETSEEQHTRRHSATMKQHGWKTTAADDGYSMPSKTLAYAYQGTTTSLHPVKPRNGMDDFINVKFLESNGAAFSSVHQAFFGKARWAKDRIYWVFAPEKDERVASCLAWIESMSAQLAAFGLHKFLQSRERGALITNTAFRLPQAPDQPVFDWITFDQLQGTMDKILQESVALYDPAVQVVVFAFLPSKSGNSVAMWRRKLKIPNNVRLMYIEHITQAIAALKKDEDYVVYVDRMPLKREELDDTIPPNEEKKGIIKRKTLLKPKKRALSPVPKKKRKWWQIFSKR